MNQPAHGEPSPRIALAELAREVALTVDGVVALDEGTAGRFVTAGGGERIGGVRALAAPDGGYDLSLRLVCALVPLPPVVDRVRAAITDAARAAALELATVTITIAGVTEDGG